MAQQRPDEAAWVSAIVESADASIISTDLDGRGATVQDLRATADNLRTLSETVKRYPAGVLVAGPPDKVALPRIKP